MKRCVKRSDREARIAHSSLFCYFGAYNPGEAFLDKAFTLHAHFVARMREPLQKPCFVPGNNKRGIILSQLLQQRLPRLNLRL
jgi:hypothetical protein